MSTYQFSQTTQKWIKWPKWPNFGIIEALLCSFIFVLAYGAYNRHGPQGAPGSSPETAIPYESGNETQSVIDVIDVKTGQNLDGSPIYYLAMQQVDPKFDEFTFVVEASPTEAYKYLGYRLRVSVITPKSPDNIGLERKYIPSQDWYIDSVYSPRSRLNENQ